VVKATTLWKRGRGKLGSLAPLIGRWIAESDSPMGRLRCTRTFRRVLGDQFVQLDAHWEFPKGAYEETALFGVQEGELHFWSFTSDGKRSTGWLADGIDIHPEAICFEAKMPAGLARMIYWPEVDGTVSWAVESKTKKGWRRFTHHHYRPAPKNPSRNR
jgi:hypothetical protein